MARRRKQPEAPTCHTEQEKHERINKGFAEIFRLMGVLEALKAEHIKPIQQAITKQWRGIKADTGTERADLDPFFRLYVRRMMAEAMEQEADAERVLANMKRAFGGLQVGETLDFLEILASEAKAEQPEDDMFERDEPAAADDERQAEVAGEIEELDEEPEPEVTTVDAVLAADANAQGEGDDEPITPAPGSDWGDGDDAPVESEFASAGKPFNEGRTAGADGMLAEANPYPAASVKGKMWEKGRKAGAASGNVVPLPTGPATAAASMH